MIKVRLGQRFVWFGELWVTYPWNATTEKKNFSCIGKSKVGNFDLWQCAFNKPVWVRFGRKNKDFVFLTVPVLPGWLIILHLNDRQNKKIMDLWGFTADAKPKDSVSPKPPKANLGQALNLYFIFYASLYVYLSFLRTCDKLSDTIIFLQ